MSKMTIEIPNEEYKELKIAAIRAGISIRDYVLDALRLKAKVIICNDSHLQENKETEKNS
jgi:hypothetical protein